MGGIGEQLRRARQEKGLTLHEVEEATKIRLKYLNALEEEAFDELPGRVYAIGFLRNYARYLGLDAEELVRQLKEIVPLPQEEPLRGFTPGHELTVSRRRWQRLLIAGLVILALIGFNKIYYLTRSLDQPPAPSQPPYNSSPVEPLKPPGSREVPPSPAESSRVAGVKIEVKVKERECWIRAVVDGKEEFQGILKKGDSRLFQGQKEIYLKLGSAGVVEITHNGRILPPLGAPGEVVEKTFSAINPGS